MEEVAEQILDKYRNSLVTLEQKSQDSYDKTVITLSTSAFGISFAFADRLIAPQTAVYIWLLTLAWTLWSLSATGVLVSHYFSQQALRKAIDQLDKQTIFDERPGGWYDMTTAILNAGSGLFFVFGLVSLIGYVQINLMR